MDRDRIVVIVVNPKDNVGTYNHQQQQVSFILVLSRQRNYVLHLYQSIDQSISDYPTCIKFINQFDWLIFHFPFSIQLSGVCVRPFQPCHTIPCKGFWLQSFLRRVLSLLCRKSLCVPLLHFVGQRIRSCLNGWLTCEHLPNPTRLPRIRRKHFLPVYGLGLSCGNTLVVLKL
jgi:hypothetical protein